MSRTNAWYKTEEIAPNIVCKVFQVLQIFQPGMDYKYNSYNIYLTHLLKNIYYLETNQSHLGECVP